MIEGVRRISLTVTVIIMPSGTYRITEIDQQWEKSRSSLYTYISDDKTDSQDNCIEATISQC
jgi:hypothetical protein